MTTQRSYRFPITALILAVQFCLVLGAGAVQAASLVAHYKFDGNVTDSAGSHNGAASGGPTYVNGIVGKAIHFDDVNDVVTINDFDYRNAAGEFSINLWVKNDDIAGTFQEFFFSHGFPSNPNNVNMFYVQDSEGSASAGRMKISTRTATSANFTAEGSNMPAGNGAWTMVTYVYSPAGGLRIYTNGQLIPGLPASFTGSLNPAGSIRLGARSDLNADRFYGSPLAAQGLMDDLRIYSGALTAAEVAKLYESMQPTGRIFYVGPNDTAGSGTWEEPYRDPQGGLDACTMAGDRCYVRAGTYVMTEGLEIKHSGTAAAPITLAALPGEERLAIIDGPGVFAHGKSHLRIRGLKVQRTSEMLVQGIRIQGSSPAATNIRVDGNWVVGANDSHIIARGQAFAYVVFGDRLTNIVIENNLLEGGGAGPNEVLTVSQGVNGFEIRNNVVRNFAQIGIDAKTGAKNGKIWGNHVYGSGGQRIYLDAGAINAVTDVEIYNNRVENGTTGISVVREQFGGERGPTSEINRIKIYNNVVIDCGNDGIALRRTSADNEDIGIYNNLQVHNNTVVKTGAGGGDAGIRVNHAMATNVVVRNNIVWDQNGPAFVQVSPATVSNNLFETANPLFVDLPNNDLHLTAGSPAKNTGAASGAPATDFDGLSRPQGSGFDIGAYEFDE